MWKTDSSRTTTRHEKRMGASMNALTVAGNTDYALPTAPHWAGGFGRSCKQGAEVTRRQVRGFFYALTIMVGGVLGSLRACRVLAPVDQPGTSSATLSLVAPVGGFKPFARSSIMNNTQSQVTPEFRPHVEIINGQIKTTSLKIAEHFGKIHRDVMRAIENIECSPEFRLRNFAQSSFATDMPNGGKRNYPMIEMTRDGFTFIAMGFTGKQAAQWKEAYITAFNTMESELQSQPTNNTCQLPGGSIDDPAYLKASRTLLIDYVDACIAAVESTGAKAPIWPELNQQVIDGLIAERLMSSRMLLSFDNDFKMRLSQVPRDSCVISPKDPVSLRTFIKECVSPELLHVVMESASQRMERYIQYLKTKLPAKG